jgi:hypothetical protein
VWVALEGLGQDTAEGLVVGGLVEEREPGRGPVKDMVDVAAGGLACGSWHTVNLPIPATDVKKKKHRCVHFF